MALSVGAILLAAQMNYRAAIKAVQKTEMSDSAIEHTMVIYGFDADAMEEITVKMKITALANQL